MQREYTHPWVLIVVAARPPGWNRHRYSYSLRLGWSAAWSMVRTFLNTRSEETHYTITLVEVC